jgi:hypothetical protein
MRLSGRPSIFLSDPYVIVVITFYKNSYVFTGKKEPNQSMYPSSFALAKAALASAVFPKALRELPLWYQPAASLGSSPDCFVIGLDGFVVLTPSRECIAFVAQGIGKFGI